MLSNRLKSNLRKLIYQLPFKPIANNLFISQNLKDSDPILIYTPPKTGSSTVKLSLKVANLNQPIYKVHYLSPQNLKISAAKYRQENKKNPPIIRLSNMLSQKIATNPDINWKIITLTREPFSRAISALFQIIERRHPELIARDGEVIIERAVKLLETELTLFDGESSRICRWFNEELKQVFDIDVYDYPFNHKDGFTIINKSHLQVLVIRLEDLNRCFAKAISSFLSLDRPPELISKNLSKNKKFPEAHKLCQQKINLPQQVCQNICNSKYVRHFYSQTEREQLIQKYSQSPTL